MFTVLSVICIFVCIMALSVIALNVFLRITYFIIRLVCEDISRKLRRKRVLELFGIKQV